MIDLLDNFRECLVEYECTFAYISNVMNDDSLFTSYCGNAGL